MDVNPLLGLLFHWIGGLASASFYVPYRHVRGWSWEIFWITGGVVSWVISPWLFAAIRTNDLIGIIHQTPVNVLFWCYFFGLMWGLGGLTFGLALRYLGLSLGMAIALGVTMIFGTLIPPIFEGTFVTLALTTSGKIILFGVVVALLGIAIIAAAGRSKEREMTQEQRQKSIVEFNFIKGVGLAIFSGVMSASFAYGLAAGEPMREIALATGTRHLDQGLAVLCIILAGGFTTNLIWCAYLIQKNGTIKQLIGVNDLGVASHKNKIPLARNFLLCTLAGLAWYLQFFFYTMGESQMGKFAFSSWTLHMASIIIFSTLWGFALKEWRGVNSRTNLLVWLGIFTLVSATAVIGIGNKLGA